MSDFEPAEKPGDESRNEEAEEAKAKRMLADLHQAVEALKQVDFEAIPTVPLEQRDKVISDFKAMLDVVDQVQQKLKGKTENEIGNRAMPDNEEQT